MGGIVKKDEETRVESVESLEHRRTGLLSVLSDVVISVEVDLNDTETNDFLTVAFSDAPSTGVSRSAILAPADPPLRVRRS